MRGTTRGSYPCHHPAVDESVRDLEQRLRASPTPENRLALARALERAGRRDDAHVVLAADPFATGVREALAAYPCWSRPDGDPGNTRWLDLPPLERAPRVRWRTELPDPGLVLPTPWGIVTQLVEGGVVLDPA